jgi:hypothetical protein
MCRSVVEAFYFVTKFMGELFEVVLQFIAEAMVPNLLHHFFLED